MTFNEQYAKYVELKPSSGGRYTAICPFHNENDGSFVVYPDGSFHCFGCLAHGTVEDFLSRMGDDGVFHNVNNIDLEQIQSDGNEAVIKAIEKCAEQVKETVDFCVMEKIYDFIDMVCLAVRGGIVIDNCILFVNAVKKKIERMSQCNVEK
ncbi:MAG: CHC2 zinc finger domain-containing protein [Candidatus Paceibacterota bacterium]